MKYGIEIVLVGLAAFATLLGAAFAAADLFRAYIWILAFVLASSAVVLLRLTGFNKARAAVDHAQDLDEPICYGSRRAAGARPYDLAPLPPGGHRGDVRAGHGPTTEVGGGKPRKDIAY